MKKKNNICEKISKIAGPTLYLVTGVALMYVSYNHGVNHGSEMTLGQLELWDPEQANRFLNYIMEKNSKFAK